MKVKDLCKENYDTKERNWKTNYKVERPPMFTELML
jgi:hypothetical protein